MKTDKKYSEIPKHIWGIVNHRKFGFDQYFNKLLNEGKTKQQAFDAVIDEIHEYFPDFKTYKTLASYYPNYIKRNTLDKKSPQNSQKTIIIPHKIIEMATKWDIFDLEWILLVGKGLSREESFNKLCEDIRYHFPMWIGVKNFDTYRKYYEKRFKERKRK